jgi:hypothetical protein
MNACRHLRWKGSLDAIRDGQDLQAIYLENQTQYSCLMTCYAWGPDDEVVAPETCSPARSCFELLNNSVGSQRKT